MSEAWNPWNPPERWWSNRGWAEFWAPVPQKKLQRSLWDAIFWQERKSPSMTQTMWSSNDIHHTSVNCFPSMLTVRCSPCPALFWRSTIEGSVHSGVCLFHSHRSQRSHTDWALKSTPKVLPFRWPQKKHFIPRHLCQYQFESYDHEIFQKDPSVHC